MYEADLTPNENLYCKSNNFSGVTKLQFTETMPVAAVCQNAVIDLTGCLHFKVEKRDCNSQTKGGIGLS